MFSPLYTLQNLIVLSLDPDAKYYPSPEKTTLKTSEECPLSVLIRYPLNTLHNPIVSSLDPETKYFPFPENATLLT